MAEKRTRNIGPQRYASPGRRLVHSLFALGGWALFIYWWYLVLRHVTRAEFMYTGLLLLAALMFTTANRGGTNPMSWNSAHEITGCKEPPAAGNANGTVAVGGGRGTIISIVP